MKSKTSSFNSTLFWGLYKRFWPIFVGYLAIWVLVLPVTLQNSLRYALEQMQYSDYSIGISLRAADSVMRASLTGGIVMSAVFAILIAMAAYSYLYSARSVSMVCALPIKREGVFTTLTLAGILGMLVSNVIVFAITAAVEAAYGALVMSYILQGFAAVCLMNIFFFGFAALCASFTGHILVLPAVYIVLNFTVAAVELFARLVLRVLLYGFNQVDIYEFSFGSPVLGLVSGTSLSTVWENLADGSSVPTGYFYTGWPLMIGYAVVGIIFAVCALLLIKHRHMETAGDVVAVRPLKPIFKYCMCVGCALVLGVAVYYGIFVGGWIFGYGGTGNIYGTESMLYMLLFMLLGAFVGYFAADMLMKKTLRVFEAKNWVGFAITAAIIAALVGCAEFDVFGYEHMVPAPESIEYVTVQCEGEPVEFKEAANIETVRRIHSSIVEDKNQNEAAAYAVQVDGEDQYRQWFNIELTYTLKNGGHVYRQYNIYQGIGDEEIQLLTDVMNSDEGVAFRKNLTIPVNEENFSYANVSLFDANAGEYVNFELSAKQMKELYDTCITPDIADGGLGRIWYITDESFYEYVTDCQIRFELHERHENQSGGYDYNYDYFDTTVTMGAARTIAWIEGNFGVKLISQSESQKILNENVSSMTVEEREKYGYEMASVEGDAPVDVISATEAELKVKG